MRGDFFGTTTHKGLESLLVDAGGREGKEVAEVTPRRLKARILSRDEKRINQHSNRMVHIYPKYLNAVFSKFIVVFVAKLDDERNDGLQMFPDSVARLTSDGAQTLDVRPRRRHGSVFMEFIHQIRHQIQKQCRIGRKNQVPTRIKKEKKD